MNGLEVRGAAPPADDVLHDQEEEGLRKPDIVARGPEQHDHLTVCQHVTKVEDDAIHRVPRLAQDGAPLVSFCPLLEPRAALLGDRLANVRSGVRLGRTLSGASCRLAALTA